MHRYGSSHLTPDDLARLVADTATGRVELDVAVPIELRYDLVEVRDDSVLVYRDVYGLATEPLAATVVAALASRGVDSAAIDPASVRALVRNIPRRGRAAALAGLLRSRR